MQRLVDAHTKKCKLCTEAESARVEAVAQVTTFAGLEDLESHLIQELKEHIYVISFLQMIQIDFARLELEATAAESEVVRTSDEFTGKAELTRTANTQEVEYKTQVLTDDGFNEKKTTNRVDFAHPGTREGGCAFSREGKVHCDRDHS